MNIRRTNIRAQLVAPLAVPIALSIALSIALAGCAPVDRTEARATTGGEFPVFVEVATEKPTEQSEIPRHGPGLYRLDLGMAEGSDTGPGPIQAEQQQFLTCMAHENTPGDVISCQADFPVRWKETDGQHRQARTVIISMDEDGDLDVRAEVEAMRTPEIMPTDITDEAVIAGLHVHLTDNEARFSTDPEELPGSVLITPDSFELVTEVVAEVHTETTGDFPAVTVKTT